ncbi:hypothetical protein LVY74_00685 [Acinetobacter sp. ME22]|uniref:hypothetical protein n=1 Tax=Acinetobacter sp. ME22 TaxID=2904802 RepID=UPI001EDACAE7|nr:hypothetical protein [Acinetobacter sp. ME22]MCG2572075.1 hypothetical protein [Acinetobacter sp. ME22]
MAGQIIENGGTFDSIVVNANSEGGYWAGMEVQKARSIYEELYQLGTLSSAQFGIELEPLFSDHSLGDDVPLLKMNSSDPYYIPYLAQNVDASIIDAETDSIKVGTFQLNQITGNTSTEVQVTFLETKDARILNSAIQIKDAMFSDDGTQSPPSDYLLKMTVYSFQRDHRNIRPFEQSYVVALQSASVPFEASNQNGVLIVPLTFIKMFPMLVNL